MQHCTSFFGKFKSNLLIKRVLVVERSLCHSSCGFDFTRTSWIICNHVTQIRDGPRKSSPPSVLHVSLTTVLISVFIIRYAPGLLFRGSVCTCSSSSINCSRDGCLEIVIILVLSTFLSYFIYTRCYLNVWWCVVQTQVFLFTFCRTTAQKEDDVNSALYACQLHATSSEYTWCLFVTKIPSIGPLDQMFLIQLLQHRSTQRIPPPPSTFEMLAWGMPASFAARYPTLPPDLLCSVQRFETCVLLLMNGVHTKSADVWLMCCQNYSPGTEVQLLSTVNVFGKDLFKLWTMSLTESLSRQFSVN
jgi:hypothetical protein